MYYSKNIEDVYFDECHHLHCNDIKSNDCLKRYFIVFDINTYSKKRIIVCNEFVKLLFNNYKRFSNYSNKEVNFYETIIEEFIISKSLNYDKKYLHGNGFFTYYVCKRPVILASTNIFKVSLDLSNGYIPISYEFYDRFIESLKSYCNDKLRYKKYKTQHQKINSILKKIEQRFFEPTILTELFTEILTLKINKNDTN